MVMDKEIPKGFQKTEIGIIPNDWLLVSYNEVFDFLPSATYSRAQLTLNDEIKYVHYGDIHTKWIHFLDVSKSDLPSIKTEQQKNYPLLKEGDLLTVDASEDYTGVGKSVEVRNIGNSKIISGLHTFLLRDSNNIIANGYKGYLHSNLLIKKQMDTLATGLKVYGVSKTNLKLIKIPLPPTKAEQTAIVTALNDADKLITELEKLIAQKKLIKQGAMQELLRPKEGWEVKKLGIYLKFQVGFPFSSKNFNTDLTGIRLVKNRDLKSDDSIIFYDGQYAIDFVVNNNDVLIGMDGDFIPCLWGKGISLLNQRVGRIIPFKKISLLFLYYYLQKPLKTIENRTSSTTVKHLSHSDIEEIELPLPDYTTQIKISLILSDMDSEIKSLEKKLNKYKMIKQGMMQNLLTGKIRLI